jgi:hypothetical protein
LASFNGNPVGGMMAGQAKSLIERCLLPVAQTVAPVVSECRHAGHAKQGRS